MAKSKKCPECPPKGLPSYMGTMADMFTLLFAFFVLLFAMSTMDPVQMGGEEGDKASPAEIVSDLIEIIEKLELDVSETLPQRDPRGIICQLPGDMCFKPMKAEIEPKLIKFLDAVVDSFLTNTSDKRQIIIEGHTDNMHIPIKFQNKYPTNWELSSARASAVVRYLIDKGVNPARVVAQGYADRWPADLTWADMRNGFIYRYDEINEREDRETKIYIDDVIDLLNETPELRRKNRRIKIIFTSHDYIDGEFGNNFDKNLQKFEQD